MPRRRLDPTRWPALQAAAQAAGFTCLEAGWLGHKQAHRFGCLQCRAEWLRPGTTAIKRAACPDCGREGAWRQQRRSEKLARLHALAQARGGACLSAHCASITQLFAFRCQLGHEWATRASAIFAGSWCPHCNGQRQSVAKRHPEGLARLQQKAQSRGGECLSGEYQGTAAH